jgi:hypothetical protein
MICTLQQLAKIDWPYKYVPNVEDEYYHFFSKIDCDSYQSAADQFPGFYYVFSSGFFEKVDDYFFAVFNDFVQSENNKLVYSKQIGDRIFLKFSKNTGYISTSDVSEYLFPSLSIEINGQNNKSMYRRIRGLFCCCREMLFHSFIQKVMILK